VLDGGINLSVAFRARHLRYCDTGDVAAAVPGIRVAMLGITVWQSAEADHLGVLPLGSGPRFPAAGPAGTPPRPAPAAEAKPAPAAEAKPAPAAEAKPAVQARPAPAWER
jgi:translation initiation factor IF-2